MQNKQHIKSALTKEKILAAAETEFAAVGFYGARVDAISDMAKVNKRMIYAHFGSKEGLYKQVLLAVYTRLSECERKFMTQNTDPVTAIRSIILTSFDFLYENPTFVRMLMWENLNNGISVPQSDVRALKLPTLEYMRWQIRIGKSLGVFREDADEYHAVMSMMNFCFSYFSNIHTMSAILEKNLGEKDNVRERAEFIYDIIIKYLT